MRNSSACATEAININQQEKKKKATDLSMVVPWPWTSFDCLYHKTIKNISPINFKDSEQFILALPSLLPSIIQRANRHAQ